MFWNTLHKGVMAVVLAGATVTAYGMPRYTITRYARRGIKHWLERE